MSKKSIIFEGYEFAIDNTGQLTVNGAPLVVIGPGYNLAFTNAAGNGLTYNANLKTDVSGNFIINGSSFYIESSTPSFLMKDTDCADANINAAMEAQATDTGSGTEDVDVRFLQQIAGVLTEWLKADADGNIILGSGRDLEISGAIKNQPLYMTVAVSDEDSDLGTGTGKLTFRAPFAMTLTDVRASVKTAPTGANLEVDVNEGGVSVLSTVISIDAGEKTSTTAATPPVISDSAIADDAEITIDIDQVGSTIPGAGLKVTLFFTRD